MDETIPEREGVVRRDLLPGIAGRSRGAQIELARAKGVDVFGCTAGGCLLTDPVIARRLRDVFERCSRWDMRDAALATFGRHFRINDKLKIIVGRNEIENRRLDAIAAGVLPTMEPAVDPRPTVVLRGDYTESDLEIVGRLLRFFAKKATAPRMEVLFKEGVNRRVWLVGDRATANEAARWSI
jgi:hypothetical protein